MLARTDSVLVDGRNSKPTIGVNRAHFRNPGRASFDSRTRNMFFGDVGETLRDEINVKPRINRGGENYGWRLREGSIQNPRYDNFPPPPDAEDSVFDYAHDTTGVGVFGGYIYRGKTVRSLRGLEAEEPAFT